MSNFPIVFHPSYSISDNEPSRFPIQKYKLLKQILEEGEMLNKSNLFVPSSLSESQVRLTHDPFYVSRVATNSLLDYEKRAIGLNSLDHFCQRAFFSAGGTLLAAKLALKFGFAANAAGGSHHAARSRGSGFCIFNDVAIAANCLLQHGQVKNVLILDLDVHQGDGTAQIFEKDDRVFTVSLHCEKNFPARKLKSSLDVSLNSGVSDDDYLNQLDHILLQICEVPADLIVYNAGVDIHENDTLGHLKVSSSGVMLREEKVVDFSLNKGVPLVITLGGGYQKSVANLANLHSMIFQTMKKKLRF